MHLRRRLGPFVLVLAVFATLSHVCVLPLHAHAAAPGTDHHEGHAVHAGSCDAVRSTTPSVVPASGVVLAAAPAVDGSGAFPPSRPRDAARVVPGSSPPLYLRHSALLI